MSNKHLNVSNLGEKKLIKRIIKKTKNFEPYNTKFNDSLYIGDDAALVNLTENNKDNYLVATSDLLIQRSHFPKEMSYFQMGWKTVTVNVSDLAATGADPLGILINLAIPNNLKLSNFDELIDGILSACCYYNIPLIGGDTNQSNEILIGGTAFGKVNKKCALKKINYKNNDLIAITDEIGLAALGFELLKEKNNKIIKEAIKNKKINQEIVELAIQKALRPKAKLTEGKILSEFATTATDITDGLASELYELYDANKQHKKNTNFGLMIYEDLLKNEGIFKEIYKISSLINIDPLDLILHIGEDFELLFTFNEENFHELNDEISNVNEDGIIIIGQVNDSNKVEIKLSNGEIEELSSKGYEHLC